MAGEDSGSVTLCKLAGVIEKGEPISLHHDTKSIGIQLSGMGLVQFYDYEKISEKSKKNLTLFSCELVSDMAVPHIPKINLCDRVIFRHKHEPHKPHLHNPRQSTKSFHTGNLPSLFTYYGNPDLTSTPRTRKHLQV